MQGHPTEPDLTEAEVAAALDRAAALFRSGRLEEAAKAYQPLERRRPGDIRAPYSLAVIDLNLGRPAQARDRLKTVLAQAPDHVTAWHNLGVALQQLRAWPAAADAYAAALALRPGAARTRHALALMLAVLGRTEDALGHHRVLAETASTRLRALGRIALLRGETITPDERAEMGQAADDLAVDPDLRVALYFALGVLLDQAGEGDAAFDAFQAGAALKCALLDRTGARAAAAAAHAASVREIARIFTPTLLRDSREGASLSDAPIFIVGMPRSGSTLIEQVLGAHPDVQDLGETALLPNLLARGGSDLATQPSLRALAEAYLEAAVALGWSGHGRFVDKTLENYVHVGVIARLFPRARILHSVRDPIDTGLSCFRQLFASGNETLYDLADIGAEYRRYREIMNHWGKVAPGRVTDVAYEALVADPGRRIRWLVTEAAGLPWSDACLSFDARERPLATASAGQARRPIFRDSVGRWRRYQHRLAPLIDALGDAADLAGRVAASG